MGQLEVVVVVAVVVELHTCRWPMCIASLGSRLGSCKRNMGLVVVVVEEEVVVVEEGQA